MKMRMAALVVLGLFWATGAVAQEPSAQEQSAQEPLTRVEFVRLVNEQVPIEDIIAQVRARGIAFQLTPDLEEPLKKIEGGEKLLQALTEPATVELEVNVPGAQITVDGEERDRVSADGRAVITGLSPGSHLISLKAEGYVRGRLNVFLKPGETHPLRMELASAVTATSGPLGTRVSVAAGTSEDALISELQFAADPSVRVERLREVIQRYADNPLALLAYAMLQDTYLKEKQYEAALATGEELLRRDPNNFDARVRQVRASIGQGTLEAAFDFAAQASQQVKDLRAGEVPPETDPATWEHERESLLSKAEGELKGLEYELFIAASEQADAAARSAALERYLQLFPESSYLSHAYTNLTFAYQQQGNRRKMLEWGKRALEADPNQAAVIVLVADSLSEAGQELERARQLASRLLNLLTNEPDKVRPYGMEEEQWAQQRQLWKGYAHTILGQILLHQERTVEAIDEFRVASTLLEADRMGFARNHYRWGFACAKQGLLVQAQLVLKELVEMGTPYAPPARELLQKVEAALARRRR